MIYFLFVHVCAGFIGKLLKCKTSLVHKRYNSKSLEIAFAIVLWNCFSCQGWKIYFGVFKCCMNKVCGSMLQRIYNLYLATTTDIRITESCIPEEVRPCLTKYWIKYITVNPNRTVSLYKFSFFKLLLLLIRSYQVSVLLICPLALSHFLKVKVFICKCVVVLE